MSKVVFVGNIPYNMGEEQLIEVFKSVGQVVGLRLVFDRETGKPRGYGFCEFADHETAQSAVRNLNNAAVGGRPLRIDLADSDPFLEGKSTQRGELLQDDGRLLSDDWRDERYDRRDFSDRDKGADRRDPNAFLAAIPPGIAVPPGSTALDTISQTLATMNPSKLMEVLAQMKAFTILHPDQARALLVAHPQLAYALFQALLLNKIVDPAILQRMLAATAPPPQQLQQPAPAPAPPMGYAPPPTSMQQVPSGGMPPNIPTPPGISQASSGGMPSNMLQQPNMPPIGMPGMPPGMSPPPGMMGFPPMPPYYRPPPGSGAMGGTPSVPGMIGGMGASGIGGGPGGPAMSASGGPGMGGASGSMSGVPGSMGGPQPNTNQNAPPASSLQKQQGPPPPHSPATQQNTVAGQSQPTQQLVPEINESQRAMLMQVMSLTPEQINTLSEPERQAINQLRAQFIGTLGGQQ